MSEIVLSLSNICKDYRQGNINISVLDNISLSVHKGEMLAIIGPSGKGKSTLLHIAGLLEKPDSGSVFLSGYEGNLVEQIASSHLVRLKNIGFIYQYHHLQRDFTAIENVMMPLLIAGVEFYEARERAINLLEELGLSKRLYNFPSMLSGGEQQRVAIARALINKPKLILADEPTGNLDPETAKEVFNLLLKQAKNFDTAIIMVSHNIELANNMDRIFSL